MPPTNPYQPPSFPEINPSLMPQKRPISEILFSFSGRIPRRTYWLWNLILYIPLFIVGAGWGLIEESQKHGVSETVNHDGPNPLVLFVIVLLAIPAIWIGLALRIKRWHDRNKSGSWIFIGMIPYIGGIWTFVECGCLRGSFGPNRFGDDPT